MRELRIESYDDWYTKVKAELEEKIICDKIFVFLSLGLAVIFGILYMLEWTPWWLPVLLVFLSVTVIFNRNSNKEEMLLVDNLELQRSRYERYVKRRKLAMVELEKYCTKYQYSNDGITLYFILKDNIRLDEEYRIVHTSDIYIAEYGHDYISANEHCDSDCDSNCESGDGGCD